MTANHILVPITAKAFVVRDEKTRIADNTPFYQHLKDGPMASNTLNATFTDRTAERGIYLHWSMPETLLHGEEQEDGTMHFPALPNRWIVQRLQATENSIERVAWIIESDFYTNQLPEDDKEYNEFIVDTITIAMLKDEGGRWVPAGENGKCYSYLGAKRIWGTDSAQKGDYLRDKLTAIGLGDPLFATYYPRCKSVFGFLDRMEGKEAGTFTYTIYGYYQEEENDPLYRADINTISAILEKMKWTVPQGVKSFPVRTLCHTTIGDIKWEDPTAGKTDSSSIPKDKIDVVIGNTSVEALSVAIKNKLSATRNEQLLNERFLNALQYNMINDLDAKDNPDAGIELEELLHTRQFQQVHGGYDWCICPQKETDANTQKSIPASIYHLLAKLNRTQNEYDNCNILLASVKNDIFFAWSNYIAFVYSPSRKKKRNEAQIKRDNEEEKKLWNELIQLVEEAEKTEDSIKNLYEKIKKQSEEVKQQVAPLSMLLEKREAARYYLANEPVLLFSGEDLRRELTSNSPTEVLKCRNATISAFNIPVGNQTKAITPQEMIKLSTPLKSPLPFTVMDDLSGEAILLTPGFANIIAAQAGIKKDKRTDREIQEIRAMQTDFRNCEGIPPSRNAICTWQQPWTPLLMEWALDINTTKTNQVNDNSFTGYKLQEIEFELKDLNNKIAVNEYTLHISGSSIMTPHAVENFSSRLDKLIEEQEKDNPEISTETLKKISQAVKSLPILSQSMDGFNDAMLMRNRTIGIPVIDLKKKDPSLIKKITEYASSCTLVPSLLGTSERFLPIRAGFLTNYSIRLIDTFGQCQTINVPAEQMQIAESMRSEHSLYKDQAVFWPRFMQPCRLQFKWLSGLASPVFGFLIPNFVDRSLQVYSNDGYFLGFIQVVGNRAEWKNPTNFLFHYTSIKDENLLRFVTHLIESNSPALNELLTCMDYNFNTICTRNAGKEQFLSLCFGNILALARASVKVEEMGKPAYVQGGKGPRRNGNYTAAEFEIKIGDQRKSDDGMIGFFTTMESGTEEVDYSKFYTHSEYPYKNSKYIVTDNNIKSSLDALPHNITVMFDPTSIITCRTGFLPAIKVDLPSLFYQEQAEKSEMLLRAMPLLNDTENFTLPLPGNLEDTWSFSYIEGETRTDILQIEEVSTTLHSRIPEIVEGFLKATK